MRFWSYSWKSRIVVVDALSVQLSGYEFDF